MIEIDDAGGGCFIGPEVLVIHNLETGKAQYLLIPPNIQERVKYAAKILKRAFQESDISKEETIRLCRGEIFDIFQQYLEAEGYQAIREKVSSDTDCLAEAKFMEILYSYGFPRNLVLKDRNYQQFYQLVSCWYFSQNKKQMKKLHKTRLHPPYQIRRFARNYPNLLQLVLQDEAAG